MRRFSVIGRFGVLALLWAAAGVAICARGGPVLGGGGNPAEPRVRLRGISLSKSSDLGASGQSFALVVGVSSYRDLPASAQLRYADADATGLRDFLVGQSGGFNEANVTLLVNKEATRENILRQLDKLKNRVGINDLVLVFFAGHGVVDASGMGFLLATDTRVSDLMATGVPMTYFNDFLSYVRARSVVLFTDACHSGALGDAGLDAQSWTGLTVKDFASLSGFRKSSFIFSAASPSQSSIEDADLGHGLFTYYLLQGLEGKADKDGDGVVRSKEAYEYVSRGVREAAARLGFNQVPEFNAVYDRSIPLAILNQAGMDLYLAWFEKDSVISNAISRFDEALSQGNLTSPEGAHSWYTFLATTPSSTPESTKEDVRLKREELLRALEQAGGRVVAANPSGPGPWDEARDCYEKAYSLGRQDAHLARQYYCTAMARDLSGDQLPAERACESALKLLEEKRIEDRPACLGIARLYRGRKLWDQSAKAYRLATAGDPAAEVRVEYAEALSALGDFGEAEKQLRLAREKLPEDVRTLRLLAEVLLRVGGAEKLRDAADAMAVARRVRPGDADLDFLYGRALLLSGKPAAAVDPLKAAARVLVQDQARREGALVTLGRAYSESGDLRRAVSALCEAEKRGSRNSDISDSLGGLLLRMGEVEGAAAAYAKAVEFSTEEGPKKSARLHKLAECLERMGKLAEAAYAYRDAARLSGDSRSATAFERHATALFLRAGRPQDAGGISAATAAQSQAYTASSAQDQAYVSGRAAQSPVSFKGDLAALERITGVSVRPPNEDRALALVFDACLQNRATMGALYNYLNDYNDFEKKIRKFGVRDSLYLPAPSEAHSQAATEMLEFLGVRDKGGKRELKSDFAERMVFLRACDVDPKTVESGQGATMRVGVDNRQQLPVFLGIERWMGIVKDGLKADKDELRAFVKDEPAMRLYVGASNMQEKCATWFLAQVHTQENKDDIPAGAYFAAPYLRFTPLGQLYTPGMRNGEQSWREALDAKSLSEAFQKMFKKENGGALYLFAALSMAGKVGDRVAGSPFYFQALYKVYKNSAAPSGRAPFDLMDFFSMCKLENDLVRLSSPSVERALGLTGDGGGVVELVLKGLGEKAFPGAAIPVVKKMAVLAQVARERPDWLEKPETARLVADRAGTPQQCLVEPALDLGLDHASLALLFRRAGELDAIADALRRPAAARAFQGALEILALSARSGGIPSDRTTGLAEKFLSLDPSSEGYFSDVLWYLASDLAGGAAGVERGVLSALAGGETVSIYRRKGGEQAGGADGPNMDLIDIETPEIRVQRLYKALDYLKHNRLKDVASAFSSLGALKAGDVGGDRLKEALDAVGRLIDREPLPPPDPKKKKKGPVQPQAGGETLAAMMAKLGAGATPELAEAARKKVGRMVGEALLGLVYAAFLPDENSLAAAGPDVVKNHDMASSAWEAARFEGGAARGNAFSLAPALALLETSTEAYGAKKYINPPPTASSAAAAIDSFTLVDRRFVGDGAMEFTARCIDLGETALALYSRGDQSSAAVVARLESFVPNRRAESLRRLLNQAETKKAVDSLTFSELLVIGKTYFREKSKELSPEELRAEPGALGAMWRLENWRGGGAAQPAADSAARWEAGLRQCGATAMSYSGLLRLDQVCSEPYEHAAGFREDRRLAERMADLKLAMIRSGFRTGCGADFLLRPSMVRDAVRPWVMKCYLTGKGLSLPPEKDWPDLVGRSQEVAGAGFSGILDNVAAAFAGASAPPVRWDDGPPPTGK